MLNNLFFATMMTIVLYLVLKDALVKYLWSPWRMKYLQTTERGCIFCKAQKKPDGPETLIVARGVNAFVILNRFPYTSGHLMIVANAHQASLEGLDAGTRAEMMELAVRAMRVLRKVYSPDGFNLGVNDGEAAGAGIADHVHLHVVPRWNGDTSFISTLAGTRVLPEALEDTCRRVQAEWELA
jgi:ATP adenylyltransferase